ncbi:peptidase M16C associated-domain-containing protein [Myxozyma melibiosi]|uniref:Presequence protease, mitochondrial n=1 Tax=Myxozyma melibiosi TaxID=54550 RepID=A0ABR1FA19_9ASCO
MISSFARSSGAGRSTVRSSLLRRQLPRLPAAYQRNNCFATIATLEKSYPIGSQIHGFTVTETKSVPEFELLAVHLKHDATGAEHLHLARNDDNNVFSIAFKTNPPDATGVPHILEHTTLCGSEKYQVRDPFFKMLNRSLANFMNAMTASDYTFYPFATTNQVDFANLRDVYLDATLHPLLRPLDFTQEGWRLEHADPRNPETPLQFKGVVYNEMKGQMSDTSYLYYIRFQESIYPSLNNSGGDPAKITDLTYEQLRDFHAKNYHPSNAKLFTYGNFPLEDHLSHIDGVFSSFTRRVPDDQVKYPIALNENVQVVEEGPVDPLSDPERQYKTSLTWFMGPTKDAYETLCLKTVTSLLIDGHSSPLYQALIESDLGTEYSPNTGLDSASPVNIFSVGAQGVTKENVEKVQQTIREVIQKTYEDGLDLKRVEAFLQQAELSRKHTVANFGMQLLYGLTAGWFNGVSPVDMLEWDSIIERFREDLQKPRFLESYLERFLLDDKPVFSFTMVPSESYGEKLAKDEEERLAQRVARLGETEKKEVYELGLELLEKQEEAEDLSSLPTLYVKDIPREIKRAELEFDKVGGGEGVSVQWRVAPTNGLTYVRARISLQDLPQELLPYLPLFSEALTNLGTSTRTMASLEDEIKLKTGGIGAGVQVRAEPDDIDSWSVSLAVSGYSVDKNVGELLRLMSVLLLETNFENHEKLRTLIRGLASGSADAIASNGHAYARNAAAAVLTPASYLDEKLGGIEQVRLMNELDGYADDALPLISAKLREIARLAISGRSDGLRIAITCGADAVQANAAEAAKFVSGLPGAGEQQTVRTTSGKSANALDGFVVRSGNGVVRKFYEMPFQVTYAGACVRGVPYTHEDSAALQILANMLTHKHLHSEIREKGGAYGGGASYNGVGGVFGYYSYRDPNPANTLRVTEEAGRWAVEKQWSERDLEEAKLSVFQGVDAPQSVDSEGMALFNHGITDDMRQARREKLLGVGAGEVRDAAERYLVGGHERRSVALLGASQDWVSQQGGWEVVSASAAAAGAGAAASAGETGASEAVAM